MELISLRADIGGKHEAIFNELYDNPSAGASIDSKNFLFKYHLLNELSLETKYRAWEGASLDLSLKSNESDPYASLEIIRPLGAAYMEGTMILKALDRLSQVDPLDLAQYTYLSNYDLETIKK